MNRVLEWQVGLGLVELDKHMHKHKFGLGYVAGRCGAYHGRGQIKFVVVQRDCLQADWFGVG